ncbi:hypothetical protein [Corynebacterium comes]|nr:hypothetical protein [Corynebacterium comes]
MNKFTRSLTVIAAASALTLAGTGVASAQSSNLGNLSSWIPGNETGNQNRGERELFNAAESWAKRSTGKNSATVNHLARTASLPSAWHHSGVSGTQTAERYVGNNTLYRFYKVERNNYRPMVNNFNSSGHQPGNWKNYGVHVTSDSNFHYVTVAYTR